jgi:hypothetical protein
MEAAIKVDEVVINQVLEQFQVHWHDPDFESFLAYLKLRYLHYQRVAVVKELSQIEFNRAIVPVLISDMNQYLAARFQTTEEEEVQAVKQMQYHYHFLVQATPEAHALADKKIKALPQFDQEILHLLRDGLMQMEISDAMEMKHYEMKQYTNELREIYEVVKGK